MNEKSKPDGGALNPTEHATLEARIRLNALDKTVAEIQTIARESHETAVRLTEKVESVINWQRRQNGDMNSLDVSMNALSTNINDKFDELKREIQKMQETSTARITEVCTLYDAKIDTLNVEVIKQRSADHDKFMYRIVGIMGALIGGLVLAIVSIRIGF